MPRKCCTIYDGKSCRTNYRGTQKHSFEGGKVYRFPDNEKRVWESRLPNKLPDSVKDRDGKISKDIGICYKHFTPNCPTKKQRGGIDVPTVAPTIFGNTSDTMRIQAANATSPREPDKRNVTAEARNEVSRVKMEQLDCIDSFANLNEYC